VAHPRQAENAENLKFAPKPPPYVPISARRKWFQPFRTDFPSSTPVPIWSIDMKKVFLVVVLYHI
jgi:hypothetical protein